MDFVEFSGFPGLQDIFDGISGVFNISGISDEPVMAGRLKILRKCLPEQDPVEKCIL
jgi:hypothetical protein